ncbi:MAG: hypothetical protein WAT70_12805, partial [Rhizobiaceae bacterium]
LAGSAVAANHYFQFFCRPVTWATVVLVLSFPPVLFFNLYRERVQKFRGVISFLFGCAACICLYCILFIWEWNLLALPVTLVRPVAILAYVPHFFLIQIVVLVFSRRRLIDRAYFKVALLSGAAFALVMAAWFTVNARTVFHALRCGPEAASAIKRSYMTERMLGISWKYHLSFCAYDGWRPPLHDPALVSALWLNVLIEPALRSAGLEDSCEGEQWPGFVFTDVRQRYSLERAIIIYQHVFPDHPLRENCSCAKEESATYLNDPLWR